MAELELLLGVAALVGTVSSTMVLYFKVLMGIKEEQARQGIKIDLFWTYVRENVSLLLREPHATRKDELLVKFSKGDLTDPETEELRRLLQAEVGPMMEKEPGSPRLALTVSTLATLAVGGI